MWRKPPSHESLYIELFCTNETIFFFSMKPGHKEFHSTSQTLHPTKYVWRDIYIYREIGTHQQAMYLYISLTLFWDRGTKTQQVFPPLHPPSNLGGFDKDQNPNSETLHAILLFQENQELLQFADAYVLIPFSMKKDPAPCAIKVMFLCGGFSPIRQGPMGREEGEASIPGLYLSWRNWEASALAQHVKLFKKISISQGASLSTCSVLTSVLGPKGDHDQVCGFEQAPKPLWAPVSLAIK